MSVNTYNSTVRVGNWFEDVVLQEDILKDFEKKKNNGELLMQKVENVAEKLLQKMELQTVRPNKTIEFGDFINVKHISSNTFLCARVSTLEGFTSIALPDPCIVGGTERQESVPRNTFKIVNVDDENPSKTSLLYGQNFVLQISEATGTKLFLRSEWPSLSTKRTTKTNNQKVELRGKKNFECQFFIQHRDPKWRLEMMGTPVLVGDPIVITHRGSNQNVCCIPSKAYKTPFGLEKEVCCLTMMDTHRAEREENIWQILMGLPLNHVITRFNHVR